MKDIKSAETDLVVFGTGVHAVKCLYYLRNENARIAYFLNNQCKEKNFYGYPVYEPSRECLSGKFVLVAVRSWIYPEISRQLEENGLIEFQDYIYYEWMWKKIVLLHGNCHMLSMQSFLQSSEIFCRNYSVYPNPLIHLNEEKKVKEEGLKNCDVYIHQDIRTDNEYGYYLSDKYMKKIVNKNAVEIVVPNLYGLGKAFFPQTETGRNRRNGFMNNGDDEASMFPNADRIIDGLVLRGVEKKNIIEFCMGNTAISKVEIEENFNLYIQKIRKREKNWDIKILDFILDNYKDKKLFYEMWHPSDTLFEKISMDILNILGIYEKRIYNSMNYCLDTREEPVYPIVKETLKLNWEETFIRQSDMARKACDKMDFKEYIEEYLWWCHGLK